MCAQMHHHFLRAHIRVDAHARNTNDHGDNHSAKDNYHNLRRNGLDYA